MKTTSDYIASGFEKIERDLDFLMRCLGEVLTSLGAPEIARQLPWTGGGENTSEGIEQAYSIAFQLLNMVEENAAARTRRLREIDEGMRAEPGLWGRQLDFLHRGGLGAEEIAAALHTVRIEPVLTAHPTEAKRSAVLEQHRAIHNLLSALEDERLTPGNRSALVAEIKVVLERLWRTGEILLQKPDLASERRGVVFHLREVFPRALAHLDLRLRSAWAAADFDPQLLDDPKNLPKVRFGTWVGGDRDGHPLVTAEVTRETLLELRRNALELLEQQLGELAAALPLSSYFQQSPPALTEALDRLENDFPARAVELDRHNPEEPWRRFVHLLRAKLPLAGAAPARADACYASPLELDADLALLSQSLGAVGARRLAEAAVLPVRRSLDIFGFHLAALDIRQNSAFHDRALGQLLLAAGCPDAGFDSWPEAKRLEFLNAELRSPRPFAGPGAQPGAEADAVLACYRVLREHLVEHGRAGIGALVVSMTRRLSDLLAVYVLAREVGLARWTADGLVSELPVVPLFETLSDLERGPDILRQFLEHPVTVRSLRHQAEERMQVLSNPQPQPVQQVMIGYSDSNKNCGIFASQWALHRAQAAMAGVGRRAGCKIRFFHGRGGTISRGAGPTHRFLDALPPGSVGGDLRLTEQGESIPQKYANLSTAVYNLELLQAGVAAVSLGRHPVPEDGRFVEWCEFLSSASRAAYDQLVNHPDFLSYHAQATPIDALETSRIGSRPARRTGQRTLDDLRAIPWVFSWNQSRHYLPGWFGVGSALAKFSARHPAAFRDLAGSFKRSPFLYYVLTNVETNLASASREMIELYAGLVEQDRVRHNILEIIFAEFETTRALLGEVFGGEIEKRRPRMLRTLELRSEALRALHLRQTKVLRAWRAAQQTGPAEAARLFPRVLLSINAIASGLRTTG